MDRLTALWRDYLDGSDTAFEQLVTDLKDPLIMFINRFTRNLSAAEELAEDSFVELLLHKRFFNFKTSVKTYLFTIGRNKAFNLLKKQKRHPEVDVDDYSATVSDGDSLEEKVIADEKRRLVHCALERLPDDYFTVLHLIYFEGMSQDEAAKIMKKNKKQIANLVFRARAAAKKELEKEGIGYEE